MSFRPTTWAETNKDEDSSQIIKIHQSKLSTEHELQPNHNHDEPHDHIHPFISLRSSSIRENL